MTVLRNLTPHEVVIVLSCGADVRLPPDPIPARIRLTRTMTGTLPTRFGGIPLTSTRLEPDVTGLPDPEPGTVLVVAREVALARPARTDLLFPDDLVRDDSGRVVACRALGRSTRPDHPPTSGSSCG